MGIELAALLGRQARLVGVPVGTDPGLERRGVELLGLVQHQVGLERLVGVLEVVLAGRAQALFEPARDARCQRLLQLALVGDLRRRVELVTLVKAQAVQQRRLFDRKALDPRRGAQLRQRHGQRRDIGSGGRRQALDCLLQGRQAGRHLGRVIEVAGAAERPPHHHQHGQQTQRGHGADAQAVAATFGHRVARAQAALGEHHVLEQPVQEEALATPGRDGRGARIDAERSAQRAHHAVDRRTLLRTAGEVHPAQTRRCLERAAARADLAQEVAQHRLQRRKLLREGEDRALAQHVALAFHAVDQLRQQALLQLLVQRAEGGQRVFACGRVGREGETPDLVAVFLGQAFEALVEAADQVGLGDQHIHRRAHAQLGLQLVQARAQLACVLLALGRALLQQILDVDGEQHAVDRLARSRALEQGEEVVPGAGIDILVAFLCGVAARGVDQHRIGGEPPLAIARAAHAVHRGLAAAFGEQKLQPGIHQRRGLARAGRTDEDVPGQLVELLAAAEPRAPLRSLQALHGVVETLRQHLRLLVAGRRPARQALQQDRVSAAPLPCGVDQAGDPCQPQQQKERDANPHGTQRRDRADGDQRPDPPDDCRQDQQAQRADHGRAQQPLEEAIHPRFPCGQR